ncbi:MAG: DEAD/DEAH box helicase [Spirochaetaceae bacterium]|nr:DEAD/DEAH box helicase [Spirochaetaceae bacterium]
MTDFSALGVHDELISKLALKNIVSPTEIQIAVTEKIFAGENLFFQSETGTGKTFAYLLPLLSKVFSSEIAQHAPIIVLSPTVELASQVKSMAEFLLGDMGCAGLFVGNSNIRRQIDALKRKPDVVVGTAARLNELITLKKLKIRDVPCIVFDEVDRLLSKELLESTVNFCKNFPNPPQILACSATLGNTKKLEACFENLSAERIILKSEGVLSGLIEHVAIFSEERKKIDTLRSLLRILDKGKIMVFTSKTFQVDNITAKLKYKNVDCLPLYSKMDKIERKRTLDLFRSGKRRILITADLMARGLDIEGVDYIIQTDLGEDEKVFIHRAGRTGRAGRKGVNFVIGTEWELRNLAKIEKKLKINVFPKDLRGGKLLDFPMEADNQESF